MLQNLKVYPGYLLCIYIYNILMYNMYEMIDVYNINTVCMKELMRLRTTLNISESVIKQAEMLYGSDNRSKAVEDALKDAIKMKKLQKFRQMAGHIEFDLEPEDIDNIRSLDRYER